MTKFQLSSFSFAVPMKMFAENRIRLLKALKSCAEVKKGSWILLQGGIEITKDSTDANDTSFRQESYFHWAFGVELPDFYGAIELDTGRTTLFMPRHPESYVIWTGKILNSEDIKKKYEVEHVAYVDEINSVLEPFKPSTLYLLKGQNTDSDLFTTPAEWPDNEKFSKDLDILHPIITECRVIKSPMEIDILRFVCQASCIAHKQVMLKCVPGKYEFQLESWFRHITYHDFACRHVGYTCICASGCNSATLHYGYANEPNSKQILDGDICVFDMGAEYCGYTADITVSFPCNGKFTDKQKLVYEAVYNANRDVIKNMKPGVNWLDMHILAEQRILETLIKGGLLKGDVNDMLSARLGAVFMPHGLGHFLGKDVHDVGGYPKGTQRPKEPGLKCLRTTRDLVENMFITVEPGCYFIDALLDQAFANPNLAKFMVKDRINEFRGIGGVRIEDDVLVTHSGAENFSCDLPRSIQEIEEFLSKR